MTDDDLTACVEVVELVTAYLDGDLPPDRARLVEAHLSGCDGCAAYVDQVRRTAATLPGLAALDPTDLPPSLRADLLAAFRTPPPAP